MNINKDTIRSIVAESLRSFLMEEPRALSKAQADYVQQKADNIARQVYGDDYGKDNPLGEKYGVDLQNDANVTSFFSVGNKKLSSDTLIINFTSALGCPSIKMCPITQRACYAVAGENRLPLTRRKNLLVQTLWKRASNAGKAYLLFELASDYIKILSQTNKPIKYIRFNEAGDFFSQDNLIQAAMFADKVREEYGVMSMAYTANNRLDFTAEVNGKPIDKIIKINASRNDIKRSPDTVHQEFFGIAMDFKKVLAQNDNVEEISDNEANRLKCAGTQGERLSIPKLTWGKWNGGEGWYYVCPCSFWKYNKDKATMKYLAALGIMPEDTELTDRQREKVVRERLTEEQKKKLDSILRKVYSPCGRECAVCHDMQGGVTPDGQIVKDYVVLTATHGAGAGNYDAAYANAKRGGNDNVKWKGREDNPFGIEKKYHKQNSANISNEEENI